MLLNYTSDIKMLSKKFYTDYDKKNYPEILRKERRCYNISLFEGYENYFLCVPFRTNINHKYAYHFKTTKRSKQHKSGLDYQKMVIINKTDYIDAMNGIVDKDEYNEYITYLEIINRKALIFLQDFIDYKNGIQSISSQEFKRRYQFSPLPYFESIYFK